VGPHEELLAGVIKKKERVLWCAWKVGRELYLEASIGFEYPSAYHDLEKNQVFVGRDARRDNNPGFRSSIWRSVDSWLSFCAPSTVQRSQVKHRSCEPVATYI